MLNKIKKHKFLLIIIFFLFILCLCNNTQASTGNEEKDYTLLNNFYYLKQYVNANYGTFTDYVICGTSGLDCGSYGVFILNPNNGYCRNNGLGSFHSNYSVIFQISGTTLYDETTTFSPIIDNWNKAPNSSTYYNGCVQYTVFSTVTISGTSCSDTFGDIENIELKKDYYIKTDATDITFDKILLYSNLFPVEDSLNYEETLNYKAYISTDNETWVEMEVNNNLLLNNNILFYYYVYQNGIYYFKFEDTTTNEIVFTTEYEVTNLGYDIFFSTEETKDPLYCYSNDFTYDTMWVYISKDNVNWESMNAEFVDYIPGDIENSKERFWHYITENRNILF